MQRRCPHLKADLSRFGTVDSSPGQEATMTCQMHGWKWRLSDGKCLSSVGHDLRCAPAGSPVPGTQPVLHEVHPDHHDEESAND
jgi:UDP-MurNAc hydroxylase